MANLLDLNKLLNPQASPGDNQPRERHHLLKSLDRFEGWCDAMYHKTCKILEAVEAPDSQTLRAHKFVQQSAVGAGQLLLDFDVPPLGESWVIERITASITGQGALQPTLTLHLDSPDPIRMISSLNLPAVANGAVNYGDTAPGNIWIPEQPDRLIANFGNLNAGATVACLLQIIREVDDVPVRPSHVNPG